MKTTVFKNIPLFAIVAVITTALLSVFVSYHWFSGGTILYYWDANVPLDSKASLQAFLYPWSSNRLPGFTGSGWSWLPYWGLIAFFRKVSLSLSSSQFLLYVILLIGSIGSFYFFFKRIIADILVMEHAVLTKIISLLFGIGYGLNLYTFYYAYFMFNPEAFIICLLPLNLLSLYSLFPLRTKIEEKGVACKWLFVFIGTHIFMSPGFTSYVFLVQYFILLGLYFFLYVFLTKNKLFQKRTLLFFLTILIAGLIHWTWFYGAKLGFTELYASQVSYGNLEDIENVSKNMSLLNLFRLFGGSMMNNSSFVWDQLFFSQSLLTMPLFLFPFAIVYLFLQMRRVKEKALILFFAAVLLGALFFMKMGNPPFIWLMRWLVKTIPYLTAFRESVQKAGLYFLLSYFILSGIGILLFLNSLKRKIYKAACIIICVIPAFILLCSPFLLFGKNNIKVLDFYYNKNKHTFSSKTIIPPEYYELKEYIEPKCSGKNILVYPRTGLISNAIWSKYNASYVGQDYLLGMVNCTISSAQIIHTEAEAARTAVYGYLNDHDIAGVKKYLTVNKLHYLLIQKDSIPYLYTSRPDVQYSVVESWLNGDTDFDKKFSNEYFSLFEFIPLRDDASYGFSLSAEVAYTNATLTKTSEYKNIFHSLKNDVSSVIVQKTDLVDRYRSLVNVYDVQSNCVGCVKVQPSKTQQNIKRGFVEKMKERIKSVIKNQDALTEDQHISMELIRMNNGFHDLLESLKSEDYQSVNEYLKKYVTLFGEQRQRLEAYQGDFFAINNKLIEMRNFVIGENDLLTAYLSNYSEDIKKYSYDRLYLADILQKDFIRYANEHIWETDSEHQIYKARLDVPVDGIYSCSAQTENQLEIQDILLSGSAIANRSALTSGFQDVPLFLKRGSYPLDITYKNAEITGIHEIGTSHDHVYEFGNLQNGNYALRSSVSSIKPQKVIMFITNGKLGENDLNNIISGISTPERIISTKILDISDKPKDVELPFTLDELSSETYYFYVASLNADSAFIEVTGIGLKKMASESSIVFHCYIQNASTVGIGGRLQVERKSPVSYQVVIPVDSKAVFLTFNQTYHPDWKAYFLKDGKKRYLEHIKNAYANAWIIDAAQGETVYIQFSRWSQMVRNFMVCVISVVICCIVFIYVSHDKK